MKKVGIFFAIVMLNVRSSYGMKPKEFCYAILQNVFGSKIKNVEAPILLSALTGNSQHYLKLLRYNSLPLIVTDGLIRVRLGARFEGSIEIGMLQDGSRILYNGTVYKDQNAVEEFLRSLVEKYGGEQELSRIPPGKRK